MGFSGPLFTWTRGDLSQRLDRCLCNKQWYDMFPLSGIVHLPMLGSDHRLVIFMSEHVAQNNGNRSFRFLSVWNDHPDFERLLKDSWDSNTVMFDNLVSFQGKSRVWNYEVFRHIGKHKARLLARIKGVELAPERAWSPSLVDLDTTLKKELSEVLLQEEKLWHQKSRCKWITNGDRNTKFFHASTLVRRRKNTIRRLKLDKKNWDTIGASIFKFVCNFFESGTLEDLANQKLLVLLPKVANPEDIK
ncbi:hypothetical protein V6N11_068129 [Hibiscus sabdariffa]|uniref:Uncharacterized protein n=1 Tax=Hibiscus sabdariffa TaxID=183260 RepID=A0ABR2ST71_9ROSI